MEKNNLDNIENSIWIIKSENAKVISACGEFLFHIDQLYDVVPEQYHIDLTDCYNELEHFYKNLDPSKTIAMSTLNKIRGIMKHAYRIGNLYDYVFELKAA